MNSKRYECRLSPTSPTESSGELTLAGIKGITVQCTTIATDAQLHLRIWHDKRLSGETNLHMAYDESHRSWSWRGGVSIDGWSWMIRSKPGTGVLSFSSPTEDAVKM